MKDQKVKASAGQQARVFSDRKRTNLLKGGEEWLILKLLPKLPAFVSPNILTGIGAFGSVIVFSSFLMARYFGLPYLLWSIPGLLINWFGDSLDGRLAYYRNIPRKWYGYALDIIMDWFSIALIGLGYAIYAKDGTQLLAFVFIVLYAWAMIIAQIRYKITDSYTIDSGIAGPTELRILIALIMLTEVFFEGSITYFTGLITLIFLLANVIDTRKLLRFGDERDRREKLSKL